MENEAKKEREKERKLVEKVLAMLNQIENSSDEKIKAKEVVLKKKYEDLVSKTKLDSEKIDFRIRNRKKTDIGFNKKGHI